MGEKSMWTTDEYANEINEVLHRLPYRVIKGIVN